MPEGDTVFRTAAALRDGLVGRTLTRCDIRVPRYATVDLSGNTVDEVLTRGKHLFIRIGPASIHSHLLMDGSWRIAPRTVPDHTIRILLQAGHVTAVGINLGTRISQRVRVRPTSPARSAAAVRKTVSPSGIGAIGL